MFQKWFAIAAVAVTGAVGATMTMAPAATEAATNQLETRSVSTFKLQPAQDRVAVTVDLAITNNGAKRNDRPVPVYIQKGASDLSVSGKRTNIDLVEQGDVLDTYEVTYPRLASGQTRELRVSYDLEGAGPDSNRRTRVTEAYAHFCWHGQRTDESEVKATLPADFSPIVLPEGVLGRKSEERTTLSTSGGEYDRWMHCVESSNPAALIEETVTTDSGEAVVVEGWPEDPDWLDDVAWQVGVALPVLTDWVELPLPTEEITIQQSSTQALGGYDGSFDRKNDLMLVSETAERSTVVTHELAHAWFNKATLAEMWMIEGGAEWAAKMTHGFECKDPASFDVHGKAKLRDWHVDHAGASQSDGDLVSYQYAASCWIHQEVSEEIGFDHMADVNHALLERLPKYDGTPDPAADKPDWREWLDAVDEIGLVPAGTTDLEFAERLMLEFGIAKPKELAGRSEARARYHDALDAWGEDMPLAVSQAMDDWAFKDAMTAMDIAGTIMDDLAEAGPAAAEAEMLLPEVAAAETIAELKALRERAAALA